MSQTFAKNANARFFTVEEFRALLDQGVLMLEENDFERLSKKVDEYNFIYGEEADLTPMIGVIENNGGVEFYFTSMENLMEKYH